MAEGAKAPPPVVLDPDVLMEEIFARKGPQKYTDGLSEDNWEEELEKIPLFMTESPDEVDAETSPALAALQDLKYQEATPHGRALALKDDGNEQFRKKKYKLAVTSYTSAIREKCDDSSLTAVLYCNRAAAHYRLGNYRSSLMDAAQARKYKPDHLKALVRGAMAAHQLRKYDEALKWCKDGLNLDPTNTQLHQLLTTATKDKKQAERDQRRRDVSEKAEKREELKLVEAIKVRGICLAKSGKGEEGGMSLMGPHPSGGRVYLNDCGDLVWPVLFLYPEYGQSDYIREFNENHRFEDHIEHMFSECAPWDLHRAYTPNTIEVYFEAHSSHELCAVPVHSTLTSVLSDKRYCVDSATPSCIILAGNTPFRTQFMSRYS